MRLDYEQETPIVALATGYIQSAIAVIRTSGKNTIALLSPLISPSNLLENVAHRSAHYGKIKDPTTNEFLDEVILVVYHAGGGFTGEEAIEIMCHGSLPGVQKIMELLCHSGFRMALPGEFTFRAFMNGKVDLTQAEAISELVASNSLYSHKMALKRLDGALSKKIDEAKQLLVDALSAVEIQLDYPGDEIDDKVFYPIEQITKAKKIIATLLESYKSSRLYKDGFKVALCGKTNAGKSSLFNLFLKEDRSIVSAIEGTTRDYLEASIVINEHNIILYDTAGLRNTDDPIESEGIKRTKAVIKGADLVLYLVDGTKEIPYNEIEEISKTAKAYKLIFNKSDEPSFSNPNNELSLSIKTQEGFSLLIDEILKILKSQIAAFDVNDGCIVESLRQKELLQEAFTALTTVLVGLQTEEVVLDGVAIDLQEALRALGELTGEVTTDDILTKMFSNFCVGK